jgi:hypothetical protein
MTNLWHRFIHFAALALAVGMIAYAMTLHRGFGL